ncbi:hypothetical protein KFE25_009897 [Diacronema lutheri]|uniref:GST N-terminal domain-containing protein n=2 Tax=Diacronema lutheri TaxID=2081491 RepID=A0A8J6C9F9_DIALT|nr:hypothetical protein KFE25_009897 [Diacronema lutheri]
MFLAYAWALGLMRPSIALVRPTSTLVRRHVRCLVAATRMSDLPPVRAPDGFAPPEPKALSIPEGQTLSALTGALALALRGGTGVFVQGWTPGVGAPVGKYSLFNFRDTSPSLASCARPAQPLRLYEYEPSPYCRKVREACAILDLNVTMLPCPAARTGFAAELKQLGGKMQVPFLVDPNAQLSMYESDDIIAHLYDAYGPGRAAVPWTLKGGFAFWTCALASMARGLAGNRLDPRARPDTMAMRPIELWGYDASPFVKPVRERLCSLALPHTMVNCARGSANRDVLVARTGRFQVPFISDPNTGVEMFESDAIVRYLDSVYKIA